MRTVFSMQVYMNKEQIRSLENKVLAKREAEARCIFVINLCLMWMVTHCVYS